MTKDASLNVSGEIVEIGAECTLEQICMACKVDPGWITQLVEYGVLEPLEPTPSGWRFKSVSIVRVAKARRLERDLGLNPAGVALVLDLLDEIDRLRSHPASQSD